MTTKAFWALLVVRATAGLLAGYAIGYAGVLILGVTLDRVEFTGCIQISNPRAVPIASALGLAGSVFLLVAWFAHRQIRSELIA